MSIATTGCAGADPLVEDSQQRRRLAGPAGADDQAVRGELLLRRARAGGRRAPSEPEARTAPAAPRAAGRRAAAARTARTSRRRDRAAPAATALGSVSRHEQRRERPSGAAGGQRRRGGPHRSASAVAAGHRSAGPAALAARLARASDTWPSWPARRLHRRRPLEPAHEHLVARRRRAPPRRVILRREPLAGDDVDDRIDPADRRRSAVRMPLEPRARLRARARARAPPASRSRRAAAGRGSAAARRRRARARTAAPRSARAAAGIGPASGLRGSPSRERSWRSESTSRHGPERPVARREPQPRRAHVVDVALHVQLRARERAADRPQSAAW